MAVLVESKAYFTDILIRRSLALGVVLLFAPMPDSHPLRMTHLRVGPHGSPYKIILTAVHTEKLTITGHESKVYLSLIHHKQY